MLTYYPSCQEDTETLARSFAQTLKPGSVLCFFGDLGAGKTTFIKALAEELGVPSTLVNSPTFQYLNIYQGRLPIFHFDLYRLQGAEDFISSGFHEFFSQNGVACVEWAEKIEDVLPPHAIRIRICHLEDNTRKVEISLQ